MVPVQTPPLSQQVGVPVLSCAAIPKLIATSYIQRQKTQTKKNRCRDKQTTRYKVVSHKFSPTTVLLSLIQLYVQLSPCGKVSISSQGINRENLEAIYSYSSQSTNMPTKSKDFTSRHLGTIIKLLKYCLLCFEVRPIFRAV